MPRKNKEDDAEYSRKVYAANKENPEWWARKQEIHKNWRERRRALRDSYKQPCVVCGESEKCCIDFHHPDETLKEGQVGLMTGHASHKNFIAEIEKCVCICSNCHRKVHHGTLRLPNTLHNPMGIVL